MNLFERLLNSSTKNPLNVTTLPTKSLYAVLQDYYDNNNLYDNTQALYHEQNKWIEAIKPLRTSVNRSVEFYVSRLCQKDIAVTAEKDSAQQAIEQFHKWSNLEAQKRPFIRSLALFGDLFVKVVSSNSKVYAEMIEPKYVTDFSTDHRGYLTEIRIDIPMIDDNSQPYTYTEYWTKEYFSSWTHLYGEGIDITELGTPNQFIWLNQMGIDFIPIVWIPFKKVMGKSRGQSCVIHALTKIDEVNRISTRLHQMLWRYNKPQFVVSANAVDKNNRPLPAPVVKGKTSTEDTNLDLLANEVLYLPGMSSMESLIPNINYDAALAVVKAMETEINQDLPELLYYGITESKMSGVALKTLLSPAVDKAEEAKSNFIAGMTRLDEMALTIGAYMGLFSGVGTYENGDFEHILDLGEIFPTSQTEQATLLKTLIEAGLPLQTAMKIAGYQEELTAEAVSISDSQKDKALGTFLTGFNSQ